MLSSIEVPIIDKRPSALSKRTVPRGKPRYEIDKIFIWMHHIEIKTQLFQEDIFIVEDRITPSPVFLVLLIDLQCPIFLSETGRVFNNVG